MWDPLFVEVCRLLCAAMSRRGAQAPGCGASVVEECGLSGGGFQALERGLIEVALRHVGSSCPLCIGKWILYH